MIINSYQIQNVLADYSKRLSKSRQSNNGPSPAERSNPRDRINLSTEGKRQAIINQVANNIVNRITTVGPQNEVDHKIVNRLRSEVDQKGHHIEKNDVEFVFNIVNADEEKTTNTMSAATSSTLLDRLKEMTRETVGQDMNQSAVSEADAG